METTPTLNGGEGKTVAILSYITIIGWLIAYFGFHKGRRTFLGSYHLRQALYMFLFFLIIYIVLDVVFSITGWLFFGYLINIFHVTYIIMIIAGVINASNGVEKPLPFIGRKAERYFPSL